MVRDFPRDKMPVGTAWNAVDLILNFGAPLRGRGPWFNQSQDIASVTAASATYIRGGIYSIFATSGGGQVAKNLALDEDGHLFDVTATTAASSIGAAVTIAQNPVFHGGTAASAATAVYSGLVIIPDGTGAAVPKKYDGTTLSNLGGSPPAARFACVYKDYTLLGNGTVSSIYYPNRTWFSPPGDPDCGFSGSVTAWDTTDSWLDVQQAVRAYGSTKNALMIFGDSQIARVRGNVPPPDTDMVVDDAVFEVGLLDPFSVVTHQDNVHWCAPEGVFRSDGVALDDLTKKGGMLHYWSDLVSNATSTWTFACGVLRDHLIVCVLDGTTFKDCFFIDLRSYAWTRHSNIDAVSFWAGLRNKADELYWGRREEARVARLDTVFTDVDNFSETDGNDVRVFPVLETAFYPLGNPGLKRIKAAYFTFALNQDLGSEQLQLYYTTSPDRSYTAANTSIDDSGTAGSSDIKRVREPIGVQAPGIALKITQTAEVISDNRSDLRIYDIAFDGHALEESRLAQ